MALTHLKINGEKSTFGGDNVAFMLGLEILYRLEKDKKVIIELDKPNFNLHKK